jgi:hypothetical protein
MGGRLEELVAEVVAAAARMVMVKARGRGRRVPLLVMGRRGRGMRTSILLRLRGFVWEVGAYDRERRGGQMCIMIPPTCLVWRARQIRFAGVRSQSERGMRKAFLGTL